MKPSEVQSAEVIRHAGTRPLGTGPLAGMRAMPPQVLLHGTVTSLRSQATQDMLGTYHTYRNGVGIHNKGFGRGRSRAPEQTPTHRRKCHHVQQRRIADASW